MKSSIRSIRTTRRTLREQSGVMLLEALVALVIFSLGLLGLVALQARAISLDQDSRYRGEAATLANQLVGNMWLTNSATVKDTYATGTTAFNAWKAQVEAALPGAANYPPTITWAPAVGERENRVTVTVSWKLPSSDVRTYTTTAEVVQ
ncbi:MAG: fimbrial assembly protein [Chitinimonas sp.]|nr:fimbrial assembly protein [Chitinimonas sp.]